MPAAHFGSQQGSFFYSNTVGAQAMVELAVEMLAPQGHETLLDCYCGVGLFGISLGEQVGHVVGIEESEVACEDFAWNAQDLNNVTLHEGPIIDVLTSLDALQRIDMAVIDPPRSGAGPEVAFQLRRLAVRKLLYRLLRTPQRLPETPSCWSMPATGSSRSSPSICSRRRIISKAWRCSAASASQRTVNSDQ